MLSVGPLARRIPPSQDIHLKSGFPPPSVMYITDIAAQLAHNLHFGRSLSRASVDREERIDEGHTDFFATRSSGARMGKVIVKCSLRSRPSPYGRLRRP
jgi:hypothetical protein